MMISVRNNVDWRIHKRILLAFSGWILTQFVGLVANTWYKEAKVNAQNLTDGFVKAVDHSKDTMEQDVRAIAVAQEGELERSPDDQQNYTSVASKLLFFRPFFF
ncbi:unnamed protein product [Amoebophrya sp. A25]|nr:unnamed protein product [Amoebophrya sp. A25]|eukprot:GSA25T00006091001.1